MFKLHTCKEKNYWIAKKNIELNQKSLLSCKTYNEWAIKMIKIYDEENKSLIEFYFKHYSRVY